MDPTALWAAVKTRAESDTGSGGLYAAGAVLVTGLFHQAAPDEQEGDYLLYEAYAAPSFDGMRTAVNEIHARFHVHVPTDVTPLPPALAADARASAIIARIVGDWHQQAYGTAPTYGFDHWYPTLTSAWTPGMWFRDGFHEEHDSDELHYVLDFKTHLSIKAP